MSDEDNIARSRFLLLNLVRLGGLALVLLGISVHYGKLPLPEPAAYVLVVAGFIEFFLLPNLIARKWRTPDE